MLGFQIFDLICLNFDISDSNLFIYNKSVRTDTLVEKKTHFSGNGVLLLLFFIFSQHL